MDFITLILFLIGLVLLIIGAELLVRGASYLAAAVGVSPLVIGLTVVAYGTSAPELAVSVLSAANNQADIALGNVVGSNIFNVLFILGVSAVITPLAVSLQLIRRDVPLMIGVSLLLLLLSFDGAVGRTDGLLLLAGIAGYTVWSIWQSRRETQQLGQISAETAQAGAGGGRQLAIRVVYIAAGLGLLVLGSRWLVNGAIALAQTFGVSELVIGLTIVAAGTSLPEVATSIIASLRGERDIAVGNVVGSNIFNILAVLGFASVISPTGVNVAATALYFDIPVMVAVALVCLPIFFTGGQIARWEGLLFLGYYVAYTIYLLLLNAASASLSVFSWTMATVVIPLTGLTLLISLVQAFRARR